MKDGGSCLIQRFRKHTSVTLTTSAETLSSQSGLPEKAHALRAEMVLALAFSF